MEPFNSAAFSLGLEAGCHGYSGILQLMGGRSVALVSWGPARVIHEMQACGCGGEGWKAGGHRVGFQQR